MLKSDFDFYLPQHLIAQTPAEPRDAARLLCLSRGTGAMEDRVFSELPGLLQKGDLLVINDSKVLPARLIGHKQASGGSCELLVLRQCAGDQWECLAKPGKTLRPGSVVVFGDGSLTAEITENLSDGRKKVHFKYDTPTLYEKLEAFGKMPLPPYIKSQASANNDYQTVYAQHPGSAAAPTAGLHFTPQLFSMLGNAGVQVARLTLHVGLGTFRPVQAQRIEEHQMHTEWYTIGRQAAEAIQRTKQQGGRVIAVGTTSCRTLEAVAAQYGAVVPASGETDIFIYPGYTFKVVDGLITNFHLPQSTLIMLVSAFCGRESTMAAYKHAVENSYRFFSFGDAMLIL